MIGAAVNIDLNGRVSNAVFLLQKRFYAADNVGLTTHPLGQRQVHGQHQLLRSKSPDVHVMNLADAGYIRHDSFLQRVDVEPLWRTFQKNVRAAFDQ